MTSISDFSSQNNFLVAPGMFRLPGLPVGFSANPDGIRVTSTDEEDPLICGPIALLAFGKTEDGEQWYAIFDFYDLDGERRRLFVPKRDLQSGNRDLLSSFLDRGFWVAPGADEKVATLLRRWETSERVTTYPHHGWLGKDHSCFSTGAGRAIGVGGRLSTAPIVSGIGQAGTLGGWRDQVARHCIGNPLLLLAVSQAFAAPLRAIIGEEGGGFHITGEHRGPISALLACGASVWGDPQVAGGWRTVGGSCEPLRSGAKDRLLVLDGIRAGDKGMVIDLLAKSFRGTSASRIGVRDRSAREESQFSWLSAGDVAIEPLITRTRGKASGELRGRVIELRGSGRTFGVFDNLYGAGSEDDFSRDLTAWTMRNHGHAGPAFVEWLIKRRDRTDTFVRLYESYLRSWRQIEGLPQNEATQNAIERFAVVAVAGELASKAGITGWPPKSAYAACKDLLQSWAASGRGGEASEAEAALERLNSYLATHPEEFALAETAIQTPGMSGYRDQDLVYFTPKVWKQIHGSRQRAAAQALKAEGHLIHNESSLQYRLPRTILSAQPKVYAVRMTVPGLENPS